MPSVTRIAPAICSGGTSSMSLVSSEKSSVPSPSGRSAACTSRTSKPPSACEPLLQRRDRLLGLLGALAEPLAGAFVDDERHDAGQRIALLALQHRVGERQHEQRRGERAERRAAHALPGEHSENEQQARRQAPRSAARAGAGRRR